MDEPKLPTSAVRLSRRLTRLHQARTKRHLANRAGRRAHLTIRERARILASTGRRCYICGGEIRAKWEADHVLCHSGGGADSPDNFLPAHRLCNNYRWDYSPEEFQWILKLGVWARTHVERGTGVGKEIARTFHEYEEQRQARRRTARRTD